MGVGPDAWAAEWRQGLAQVQLPAASDSRPSYPESQTLCFSGLVGGVLCLRGVNAPSHRRPSTPPTCS